MRARTSAVALAVNSIATVGRSLIVGLDRLATDRIYTDRSGAAPEALETEILEQEIIETWKPFQRVTGCEELTIEVSGCLLDAGRRVHHVSVIDNRSPAAADFASDHWPRAQGSAESGHRTELAVEHRCRLRERSLDREETGRGTCTCLSGGGVGGRNFRERPLCREPPLCAAYALLGQGFEPPQLHQIREIHRHGAGGASV
jgi:hypothetical protein